jgi:hypothetical protein
MLTTERRDLSRGRASFRPVPRRTKLGLVIKPFTIDPRHWEALRREAFKRAADAGSGKPDASAVLREILDAWIAKPKKT